MSTVQLINELRKEITDANKKIRLLETEIQDKVSEIYKLQNEFALIHLLILLELFTISL